MKKIIATLLALTSILTMFMGCSNTDNQANPGLAVELNELQTTDITNFGEATYDGISIFYDTHVWTQMDMGFGTFSLIKRDDMSEENATNISFAYPDVIPSGMTESQFLAELKQSIADVSNGVTKSSNDQVMKLGDFEVAYIENVLEITDDVLDMMIELGVFTEEMIEMSGGREAITSIPATKQVSIGRIVGEKAYTFTGTYYSDADKQLVIDAIAGILENIA